MPSSLAVYQALGCNALKRTFDRELLSTTLFSSISLKSSQQDETAAFPSCSFTSNQYCFPTRLPNAVKTLTLNADLLAFFIPLSFLAAGRTWQKRSEKVTTRLPSPQEGQSLASRKPQIMAQHSGSRELTLTI